MSQAEPVGRAASPAAKLVKLPQHRRGGTSAVYLEPGGPWGLEEQRVYVKRQSNYYCRPPWRCFLATPTLRREVRALRAWRRLGIPVPVLVSYRQEGLNAELALAEVVGALPLAEAFADPCADRLRIIVNLATHLGRLHRAGWTHGSLRSEHILVLPSDSTVVFLDLEKARRSRRLRERDLARFWRSADFLRSEERVTFQSWYEAALR